MAGVVVPPGSPSSDPNHLHGLSAQTSPSVTQNNQTPRSPTGHVSGSHAGIQSIPSAVSIHSGPLQAWISGSRHPRSTATTLSTQTTSTSNSISNTPPPTQPLDEFRDPILLTCTTHPGSKHYPYVRLGPEHEERAPQLKGILLEAVIQSKAYLRAGFKRLWLRDCRDKISFREGICGTSPAEAKPSVIITCPAKICSMLRTELSSEGTRFQYASDVTPGPAFDLYFCPSNRAYHLRWCTVPTTVDPFNSEDVEESDTLVGALTMCGARINAIKDDDHNTTSSGTVSCILHIKGVPYLLTSAHPFCSINLKDDSLDELLAEDDGEDDSEIFYAEEDEHLVADTVEYHNKGPVGSPSEADADPRKSSSEYESTCMIIPGFTDLGSDNRDYDWAVRPITQASERLPNAYSPDPMTRGLRYITEVANGYSKEENGDNRVHILTSTGVKAGTLLPGRLMISGLSGRGFCDVLVVMMERNSEIIDGDSGSLVVNATTNSAYGHVVATGPDGAAYIVPLRDTICQIKTFFGTTDVRFPDPLSSLTEIALFYLDNKQTDLAQKSLVALGNLVSQVCDSREWQRLCHWIETCAARGTLISMSGDKFKGNYYDRDEDIETLKVPLTASYILERLARSDYISQDDMCAISAITKHIYADISKIAKHVLLEIEQRPGCLTNTHYEAWLGTSATTNRKCCKRWTKRSRLVPQKAFLHTCWLCTLGTHFDRKVPTANNKTAFPSWSWMPWISHDWTYKEAIFSSHRTTVSSERLQSCLTIQQGRALLGSTQLLGPLDHLSDPLELALASQSYRGEQLGSGGFATVYRFTLPGTLHGNGSHTGTKQFAMKIISRKTTAYSLWATEKQALERLTKYNNPHIIELLASRCTDKDYRLLFPLAQCTMDELMQSDPLPSQELSSWMAEQFYGLASALESMHNMTTQECVRHGDLKPENILWFSNDTSEPELGTTRDPTTGRLVIADLGLAKFHRIATKKRQLEREQTIELETQNEHTLLADRRYAAPEIEIPTNTYFDSRAYDIWSLGCVMLEFLVWYMHGADGRQRLRRSLQSQNPDHFAPFWHIDMGMQSLVFSLQSQVSEQLQMLQDTKQENTRLQGTIDLILYGGLLDPDPDLRPTAREIGKMFSRVVSGLKNECLHPSSPVWARSWTPQVANGLRSQLSLPQLPDSARSIEQVLVGTGIKGLGAAEEIEPQSFRIDTSNDPGPKRETSIKQKCPYCSQKGRPVAIKYHVRALHRNQKPIECPLCGYLYLDQKRCAAHCLGCGYPILIDQLRSPYTTGVHVTGIKQWSPLRTVFDENSNTSSPTRVERKFEGDGEDETTPDTRTDKRAKVKRPAASAQLPQMRSGRVRRNPDDDFHGDGSCVT